MASTIAAITTGTGGIVQTADASGNLSLLSGATTVVAVTSAGVAVTGTLSATGAVTLTTALPVLQGGTGVTTSTGTGNVVLSASPTFTGTPLSTTAASATNTTQIATTAFAYGTASKANPGYQVLPSGMIIQFGFATVAADTRTTYSFPTAFPTACVGFGCGTDWVGNNGWNPGGGMFTSTSQYILYNVDGASRSVSWMAIGY